MHLQNSEEFKTENWSIDSAAPAFFVRATIKGLEFLYGILVTLKKIHDVLNDVRDMQSNQGNALNTEQACKVLGISKNKLQGMRESGRLIEGVHFWQDDAVIRYPPDLGKLSIESHKKDQGSRGKDSKGAPATGKQTQADRDTTRNIF